MTPWTDAQIEALIGEARNAAQDRWRELHGGYPIQPDPRGHPDDKLISAVLRLTAALAVLPQGGGWLPIESAPRDGTYVLLAEAGTSSMTIGFLNTATGNFDDGDFFSNIADMTHWRPLPEPPAPPVAPEDGEKRG